MHGGRLVFAAIGAGLAVSCPAPAAPSMGPGDYRVLQVNLCNSGWAPCYTGRAQAGVSALVNARRPSVVTLNETCEDDLPGIRRRTGYVGVFTQSGSRRCTNGLRFGNAVLFPASTALTRRQAIDYASQDPGDPERRTLTCVLARGVRSCVTHLSTEPPRLAQATEMASVLVRHAVRGPAIVAGDLNMRASDAGRYVPSGMRRRGDGQVQHVIATRHFGVVRSRITALSWTDHPALEVDLRRRTTR